MKSYQILILQILLFYYLIFNMILESDWFNLFRNSIIVLTLLQIIIISYSIGKGLKLTKADERSLS